MRSGFRLSNDVEDQGLIDHHRYFQTSTWRMQRFLGLVEWSLADMGWDLIVQRKQEVVVVRQIFSPDFVAAVLEVSDLVAVTRAPLHGGMMLEEARNCLRYARPND